MKAVIDSVLDRNAPPDADGAARPSTDGAPRGRSSIRAVGSVIDQAIVSGTNFVTTVVIGRLCSKHELGVYYLAFSIVLLLRGIQFQLVSGPYMIYWSRRSQQGRGTYLGSTLIHEAMLTGVVMAFLFGQLAVLSLGTGPADLIPVVLALLAFVPFLLLREFIRNLAMSHLRVIEAIVIDGIVAAVQIGAIAVLASMHALTITAVYVIMGAACLLACVGWMLRRPQPMHIAWSQVLPDWKQNWSFGKWALASHLLGGSTPYIMPWIVALARSESDTGVLAAAGTLVGLSNTFVTGLGNFMSPQAALAFSAGGVDAMVAVLLRFALVFAVTLGAFCALISLFGNSLAVLLYGQSYSGIGTIITLLAGAVIANSMRMTVGTGLWSVERPRASFIADMFTMACTLTVAALCVRPWGVLGAAIGMFCGSLGGALMGTWMLVRYLKSLKRTQTA